MWTRFINNIGLSWLFIFVTFWCFDYGNTSPSFISEQKLFDSAIVALQKRDFQSTLASLSKSISYSPESINKTLPYKDHLYRSISNSDKRALALRARVYTALGQFDKALKDHQDAGESSDVIKMARRRQKHLKRAIMAHATGKYAKAFKIISKLISSGAIEAEQLYLLRAECSLWLGNYASVRSDASRVLSSDRLNTRAIFLISKVMYTSLGNVKAALKNLGYCIKLAPDDKSCSKAHQQLRRVDHFWSSGQAFFKAGNYTEAIASMKSVIDVDPTTPLRTKILEKICLAFGTLRAKTKLNLDSAKEYCTSAIEALRATGDLSDVSPEDRYRAAEMYLVNAWTHLCRDGKEWGRAQYFLSYATRLNPDIKRSPEYHELVRMVEAQEKAEKKKNDPIDFYELLGIAKDATLKMIKKAYRNLALKWHPDKFRKTNQMNDGKEDEGENEMSFEEFNAMFIKISEAYNILSDPDKRSVYDQGYDPNTGEGKMRSDQNKRRRQQETQQNGRGNGPQHNYHNGNSKRGDKRGHNEKREYQQSRDNIPERFYFEFDNKKKGWQEVWKRSRKTGFRERVRINRDRDMGKNFNAPFGLGDVYSCRHSHYCISRRLQPKPRALHRVKLGDIGERSITINYTRPVTGGHPPTMLFVLEGHPEASEVRCIMVTDNIPEEGMNDSIITPNFLPGTWYNDISVVVCSTLIPENEIPNCSLYDFLECSMPVKIPPFHTKFPLLDGQVNDGTLDGGGWDIVRRVAPPDGARVDGYMKKDYIFNESPIGIGLMKGGHNRESIIVSEVREESLASTLNVEKGWELVTIDGHPVERLKFSKVTSLLRHAKFPLTLTFLRPGPPIIWHKATDNLTGMMPDHFPIREKRDEDETENETEKNDNSNQKEKSEYIPPTDIEIDPLSYLSFNRHWHDAPWTEMLFSTGDGSRWVIIERKVLESSGCLLSIPQGMKNNLQILARKSHLRNMSHYVNCQRTIEINSNRGGRTADRRGPFIYIEESTQDRYGYDVPGMERFYAEDSANLTDYNEKAFFIKHGGWNVWIRNGHRNPNWLKGNEKESQNSGYTSSFAPQDCVISKHWGKWGECSKKCGGGQQMRKKIVKKIARFGGKCDILNLDLQEQRCNAHKCVPGKHKAKVMY